VGTVAVVAEIQIVLSPFLLSTLDVRRGRRGV
jgi:hypothetical protein